MKVDWKAKLSSRKLWVAVIGFITALLITFNVPDMTIEKIAGLITAMGGLIAFIFSEAYVDGKREEGIVTAMQYITDNSEDDTIGD